LNVWRSLETARLQQEGFRRQKVENTFRLIEKWDDKALLEARSYSRAFKDREKQLSPEQLLSEIKEKPQLRQSVVLIFNYFYL
jgi:quinol monooxygenase YgiN